MTASSPRSADAELAHLWLHDPLTGLPNRRLLRQRLNDRAQTFPSACLPPGCCLLIVEIDRFRALNDALGEAVGDALLVQVGARLSRTVLPRGGLVARISGDEFAVFCDHMASAGALALAETLRESLSDVFEVGGTWVSLTASVGIALVGFESPGIGPDDLLAHADLAVQVAKRGGGNSVNLFSPELRDGVERRLELEQELRALLKGDSVASGRFDLLYQPCISLAAAATSAGIGQPAPPPLRGFEALLRWHHPRLGSVSPGEFIGIAEQCGLIEAVGDWVLRRALSQLAEWRNLAADLPPHMWRVAVNVSPRQLARPGFASELLALLAKHKVSPGSLAIEVTEGVFADQQATSVVAELRQAGLRIAVDDFGIGYSSLSYLRRLPADELKFDRSFLQQTDGAAGQEAFLAALVQLARAAGLSVLAEGVETEEHLAAVSAAGCDAAQGWLFARALSAEAATEWIEAATAAPPPARPPVPFSFRDIVEAANDGVLVTTTDLTAPGPSIVYANPAFVRMTGCKLSEMLGRSPRIFQGPETDLKLMAELREEVRHGRPAHACVVNYGRSGMPYWVDMRVGPLRDHKGNVTHYVAIERDVSQDMTRLDELDLMLERDPLTGIANRRGLERFAERMASNVGPPLCIATIDLDRFQHVNDRLGHAAGDALLLGVVDLLLENMRRADFIGRIGGDKFVICMPSIKLSDALSIAQRLQRTIAAASFPAAGGVARVDCSIGVAQVQPDDPDIITLFARARTAVLAAKSAGRGRVALACPTGAEVLLGQPAE
jgi:diguanylate cyclase (GGDEF)-like protein/PAS domain S-box-containing protein